MMNKLPLDIHYTEKVCAVLADVSTAAVPGYRELFRRYPHADGMRDISICTSYLPTDTSSLAEMVAAGDITWAGIGWLLYSPFFTAAARRAGMTAREYADFLYARCDEINRRAGYLTAWIEAYGEIGNSVTWPQGQEYSKREALDYFRRWITGGQSHTEHWRRLADPSLPNFYTDAVERGGLRRLPVYYSEGTLFALHEAFRMGFPLVAYEGQCGTMNAIQTGIAFARGGAKMYDALWGCDFSPWTGEPLGELAQVSADGNWREGMTADYMFRTWMTAYMSGCNTLLHEVGYTFFYAQPREGLVTPTEYGYNAMRFYALKESVLSDRGRAVAPIALMLEEAHGYRGDGAREYTEKGELADAENGASAQDRACMWQNRTPGMSRGDWQVHRLISHIWPLPDNRWGQAARDWPDEEVAPFEKNIGEKLRSGEEDPREYARFLSDSRWADCFDIINETASADVLERYYKAVVLAGEITADGGLWERLERFMRGGGTVLLSADQLNEPLRARIGVAGRPRDIRVRPRFGNIPLSGDAMELPVFDCAAPSGITAVAQDADTRRPLAVAMPVGEGRLIVTLVSYGMDSGARRVDPVFDALMEDLYGRFVCVRYAGEPIQMLVNETGQATLVTLLNHTGAKWSGEVILRRPPDRMAAVWDVIAQVPVAAADVACGGDVLTIKAYVPAYGVKVLAAGERMPTCERTWPTVASSVSPESAEMLGEIIANGPSAYL